MCDKADDKLGLDPAKKKKGKPVTALFFITGLASLSSKPKKERKETWMEGGEKGVGVKKENEETLVSQALLLLLGLLKCLNTTTQNVYLLWSNRRTPFNEEVQNRVAQGMKISSCFLLHFRQQRGRCHQHIPECWTRSEISSSAGAGILFCLPRRPLYSAREWYKI